MLFVCVLRFFASFFLSIWTWLLPCAGVFLRAFGSGFFLPKIFLIETSKLILVQFVVPRLCILWSFLPDVSHPTGWLTNVGQLPCLLLSYPVEHISRDLESLGLQAKVWGRAAKALFTRFPEAELTEILQCWNPAPVVESPDSSSGPVILNFISERGEKGFLIVWNFHFDAIDSN